MTESAPYIDYDNLPTPNADQGILATLFITVRKVARSRDFYSRVLGGTVVWTRTRASSSCPTHGSS
jgi:glyoxalase/bleomycin resistance protein/dioxygenase superfamily protein